MMQSFKAPRTIYYYGSEKNDLYQLLRQEGFTVKKFNTPGEAIKAAGKGAAVLILPNSYPDMDPVNRITDDLLSTAKAKGLQLYVEYPSAFPGLNIPSQPLETRLERAVITSNQFGGGLQEMALMSINNCHVLPVEAANPMMVLAKVVGFDKAEYGLADTKTYPLLFERDQVLVSTTGLSNFKTGRYGPAATAHQVWNHILSRLLRDPSLVIKNWPMDVKPSFARNAALPGSAKLNSIRKGVDWFYNGRFFVGTESQKAVKKFEGDGSAPIGPPVSQQVTNGDGSMGILEGHTSTINYDGTQQYRYWMRADVQGEVSMALAAAGDLFNNSDYKSKAAHLIDYVFTNSNLRAGAKNDSTSAAYGLIGWATTNSGTFYGDDNSRAILGMIAAASYLHSDQWDKKIAEAIMANFRTTGKQGFRGERLEEKDILRNGIAFYQNRDLLHISPHFESWMWACYLWLYSKTGYEPLLTKTREAIRITMNGYPDKWRWGSSMQTQRARMILPLAWLVRVDDSQEHRQWLDKMVNEILRYQDSSGAIIEELGKGKGMFRELKKNSDYGSDEGSLIFKNGEKASCMLYTCNFAIFSLNEAAAATGNKKYKEAVNKLSDFLTRIQVQSNNHRDLDGGWFRAFDFGRWDYWASNSDAGWGAWCTLTGWIQSWIVTTQAQIQQRQSFWSVTKNSTIGVAAKPVIEYMMKP